MSGEAASPTLSLFLSSVLFLSINEVHYVRILYHDLLFQSFYVFRTSNNWVYLVKYKLSRSLRLPMSSSS